MRVLFRKDKSGEFKGDITAVFIDDRWRRPDGTELITLYAHVGQHSDCSIDWVKQDTVPATKSEYRALYSELKAIGYDKLEVINSLRGAK